MAGHLQKRCASLFETKERDPTAAVDSYRRASNYYLAANMQEQSRRALERAARLLGGRDVGRHLEAARLYASIGRDLTESSNLTKRSAGRAFFLSGLLYLAADGGDDRLDELGGKLREFRDADYLFKTSREHAFLERTIEAVRTKDLTSFADHVYCYDSICHLDVWCLDLLDRLRSHLHEK